MENNELDDLFRSNSDYLGDEPPRDFDKEAFWQQLQAEFPKKTARRRAPAAWRWAAASVLLAGMIGAIWWMQLAEVGVEKKLAEKVGAETLPTPQITNATQDSTNVASLRGLNPSKVFPAIKTEVPIPRPTQPEAEQVAVKAIEIQPIKKLLSPENEPTLPEVIAPTISEKPVYRVVHINEIRQRKQQEAKARSRVTFRIGIPAPPPGPEPPEGKFLLSIPIPH